MLLFIRSTRGVVCVLLRRLACAHSVYGPGRRRSATYICVFDFFLPHSRVCGRSRRIGGSQEGRQMRDMWWCARDAATTLYIHILGCVAVICRRHSVDLLEYVLVCVCLVSTNALLFSPFDPAEDNAFTQMCVYMLRII